MSIEERLLSDCKVLRANSEGELNTAFMDRIACDIEELLKVLHAVEYILKLGTQ